MDPHFVGSALRTNSAAGALTGGPEDRDSAGEGTGGTFSWKVLELTADRFLGGCNAWSAVRTLQDTELFTRSL
jgi:hypothetical protein